MTVPSSFFWGLIPLSLQEVTWSWQADPSCSMSCYGLSDPQKSLGLPDSLPHHHRQFQVATSF